MARKILGILAGLIAAFFAIVIVQVLSSMIYPMPDGIALDDRDGLKAHMETLPLLTFWLVVLSYVLGGFVGGFVSTFVAKTRYMPAMVVGAIFTIFAILNGFAMPQPLWVSVLSVLVFLPIAGIGARMVRLR